jgi:hypothetical protein
MKEKQAADETLYEIGEGLGIKTDTPGYGSVHDLWEFEELTREWSRVITNATSARQLVLETWLLVDHWTRTLLAAAFGLASKGTPEMDLRHELLPQSFARCLDLIVRLHKIHSALPVARPSSAVSGHARFWFWLRRERPQVMDALSSAEKAYLDQQYGPANVYNPLSTTTVAITETEAFKAKTERLPQGWLDAIEGLGQGWFESAKRLNKARNLAAHSTKGVAIAAALGITGGDVLENTRDTCRQLVESMLGVTKTVKSPAASDSKV